MKTSVLVCSFVATLTFAMWSSWYFAQDCHPPKLTIGSMGMFAGCEVLR